MYTTVNKCEKLKTIITRLMMNTIPLSFFLVQLMSVNCSASNIFINEFHYDNTGADKNEQVEIAGPAGTQLNNWQLIFYNGSNGTGYFNQNLSGMIIDQSNGFGTLSFIIPSIQNGPADAIALVNEQQNVIEFIGYEGSLLALNGPAAGMYSTDINWVETGSSDSNDSIQRQGTGTKNQDFYWTINKASPNAINQQQIFETLVVPIPASGWLLMSVFVFLGTFKRKLARLTATQQ